MSVFTNPATGAAAHAAAYVSAVLELLGDREPIAVLGETTSALSRAIEGLSPAQLRRPEQPGKWSIAQTLQHLADSEVVWAWRMRLILAQDQPPLTGYDQDLWAERLHYDQADPSEALELFAALRRANLRLIDRASPADLKRVGVHVERGTESLEHLLRLYGGHDLLHLRQIERIRRAVAERSSASNRPRWSDLGSAERELDPGHRTAPDELLILSSRQRRNQERSRSLIRPPRLCGCRTTAVRVMWVVAALPALHTGDMTETTVPPPPCNIPRPERGLTRLAFSRLLAWLDDGVDSQGETYLEIRRRLAC